jgi:hypothetical protein
MENHRPLKLRRTPGNGPKQSSLSETKSTDGIPEPYGAVFKRSLLLMFPTAPSAICARGPYTRPELVESISLGEKLDEFIQARFRPIGSTHSHLMEPLSTDWEPVLLPIPKSLVQCP